MKKLLFLVFIFPLLFQCSKDNDAENSPNFNLNINGNMQKGPYINGTSITLFELTSSLEQTGKVYNTQIKNNLGYFEINDITLESKFVEFSANGYYYNEVGGYISEGQLNLFALSDITDKTTFNVNILTHLEKKRIEYLIKQGNSFGDSKKIAQTEILAIFGIKYTNMNSSESLDITKSNDQNAILLAISIILQGNLTVGQLTELLANISNDIQTDGILDNSDIIKNLRNSTNQINLQSIRNNLTNRYEYLNEAVSIPDFEKYIIAFLDYTQEPLPILETMNISSISEISAIGGGNVIDDNGLAVTSRGLCWGTSPNPTIGNNFSVDGSGLGSFESTMTNLSAASGYYVRAYATNSAGTAYGNEVYFPTLDFKTSKVWSNYDTENIYLIDSRTNLFKSNNNAKTWEYISTMGFGNYYQLEIINNNMYACNRNNIYKSTDEGRSWQVLKRIDSSDSYLAFDIDENSGDIYAATRYALFRFDGQDWNLIKTTTSDNGSECIAVDHDGSIYYSTYLFTIHKSVDKGVTWTSNNYQESNQGWSTTGNMYVTDDNVLLMNRWWNGIWWLSGMDCIPLNNGLPNPESFGTAMVVNNGSNYYTLPRSTAGILGIFKSSDKGGQWFDISHNFTQYDLIKFNNISINKFGNVFISIGEKGVYILNESLNQWDLL